jgi:hypothetical protein
LNLGIDDIDNHEIQEKLRELKEEQEQDIQKLIDRGEIIDYSKNINSNGKKSKSKSKSKSKQKQQQLPFSNNSSAIIKSEKDKERNKILNEITRLRQENLDLSFEQWSNTLIEKRQKLKDKVNEYFPDISLELDFILSIKTILNIEDITLPFMGIVFAVPSSMKTQVIELLRKWIYSYFTDKFTAKSFVSHSATVAKDKLAEVDMLPRIKNKILLTPELSPLFTGKEEDIKEQFGIITRLLDGKGLLTESGVHGQRGYEGDHMFTWIGAAVDIPYSVYKFLSTIGFKIYFLRLPRTDITADDLIGQLLSDKPFSEKMRQIEKLLIDYLNWFEICPISVGLRNIVKIEWDKSKDDRDAIKNIADLAILLARLRGNVYVSRTSNSDDFIPFENNNSNNNTNYHTKEFVHGIPTIENPRRAVQQLYNLVRGHSLSLGRNYITKQDIPLILKVVLSTGSIERVLILDLLIAYKGTLTTSQITTSMRVSKDTAKKTMTEFKGLELVTMDRIIGDNSNSEYKITLNPKFKWILTEVFTRLREDFKPTDNKEYIVKKSKNNSAENGKEDDDKKSCCDKNTPCANNNEDYEENHSNEENIDNENNNNDNSHKGENHRSKNIEDPDNNTIKVIKLSPNGDVHWPPADNKNSDNTNGDFENN